MKIMLCMLALLLVGCGSMRMPPVLVVIPMDRPTGEGIQASDLPAVELTERSRIVIQAEEPEDSTCREVDVTDATGAIQAFKVCIPK